MIVKNIMNDETEIFHATMFTQLLCLIKRKWSLTDEIVLRHGKIEIDNMHSIYNNNIECYSRNIRLTLYSSKSEIEILVSGLDYVEQLRKRVNKIVGLNPKLFFFGKEMKDGDLIKNYTEYDAYIQIV